MVNTSNFSHLSCSFNKEKGQNQNSTHPQKLQQVHLDFRPYCELPMCYTHILLQRQVEVVDLFQVSYHTQQLCRLQPLAVLLQGVGDRIMQTPYSPFVKGALPSELNFCVLTQERSSLILADALRHYPLYFSNPVLN